MSIIKKNSIISIILHTISVILLLCTPWISISFLGNSFTFSFPTCLISILKDGTGDGTSIFVIVLFLGVAAAVLFLFRIILLLMGRDTKWVNITSLLIIAVLPILYILFFRIVYEQLRQKNAFANLLLGAGNLLINFFTKGDVDLRHIYQITAFPYLTSALGCLALVLEAVEIYNTHQKNLSGS